MFNNTLPQSAKKWLIVVPEYSSIRLFNNPKPQSTKKQFIAEGAPENPLPQSGKKCLISEGAPEESKRAMIPLPESTPPPLSTI